MAEDVGFLEQLTGGSAASEEGVARDRIRQLIANPNNGDAGLRQMFFGLGRQAGGGGAALAGGLGTGFFGKKEGESFGSAVSRGVARGRDGLVANANNISVDELRTRRRIRNELAKAQSASSGDFDARIKLAQRAAQIATEEGDSASMGRALSVLQDLKTQQKEFDRLSAQTKRTQVDSAEAGLSDVFREDGTPITGVLGNEEGPIAEVGGVGTGIWFSDKKGELVFERFGDNLSREDPTNVSNETVDERIRKLTSKKERELIRTLVVNNDSSLRKSRRVMSTLHDLHDKGGGVSVVGASGEAVNFIDNTVRNLRGLVSAFSDAGAMKKDMGTARRADGSVYNVRQTWLDKAQDAEDDIWQVLPEEFRRVSAAATQYRAQVLEMAYMAARLAEPSNRGLSDKDISNALLRIAGNSSNPQSIIRRFIEMQADSAAELETRIQTVSGSISGVSDTEIERVLAGNALPTYRSSLQKLYGDFDIRVDDNGRAIFGGDTIDTDVSPGEGTNIPEAPSNISDIEDDEEFLNALFGEQ